MSLLRTNKKMKQEGDFPTRTPKSCDFTEYVYVFVDGTKTTILRSELSEAVDDEMYEGLKKEANNNEVQIEKHRGYAKDEETQDALLNMRPAECNLEDEVIEMMEMDELYKAVATLLPQQRDTVIKKHFENKSNSEIAREEGVTEGAIRDRLKRAHENLKKKLLKKFK